nr:hypothetical protein [Thermus sp. 2.9]
MREWGGFLLALLVAFALWYSLRERAPVVERAVSVPLRVLGLEGEKVAEGVPKEVLLRLRGPAPLVEGTPPVSAYLDLSEVEGTFAREVRVAVPQGVEVLEVRPARVEGRVEAVLRRTLPVEVLSQGAWVATDPAFVEARGPRSQVEGAVAALGLWTLGGRRWPSPPSARKGPCPGWSSRPRRCAWWPGRRPFSARRCPSFSARRRGLGWRTTPPRPSRWWGPRRPWRA